MQDGELSQDEIIRRLTALLLQVGNIPHASLRPAPAMLEMPEIVAGSDVEWRNGVIYGICMAAAVAGGGGLNGPTPIHELASSGLSLARSVQFQWMED